MLERLEFSNNQVTNQSEKQSGMKDEKRNQKKKNCSILRK